MKKDLISKTLLWDLSLLMVAMVWGGGFVVTKNALDEITPMYFLAIRFLIAAAAITIVFYKQLKSASWEDIKNGCVVGIFLFMGFVTQTVGANYTTPAKSSFITGLNVVLVPFVGIVLTKKFPHMKAVFTALLAFIGIGMLSLNDSLTISYGDFLTLLCAVAYAGQIVSIGYYAKKTDPIVLAAVQIIFTAIACTVSALIFEPRPAVLTMGAWGGILYTALLGTFAALIIQNMAQKNTPAAHAAIIMCLEAVFGALASALFWNEVLTPKAIMGCVMIFIAIIVNEVDFKQILNKPDEPLPEEC